jgi:uncharacterized protein (DUF2267 family)
VWRARRCRRSPSGSRPARPRFELLPEPLRACAVPGGRPERFDLGEFLRRVAHRANVGEQAERDVRGVFTALFRAVGPDEFADMRTQLPEDFDHSCRANTARCS